MTIKPLVIIKSKAPRYCNEQIMNVHIGSDEKPWFYDVQKFIEERKYPDEATSKDKYTLHVVARNYASLDVILYKRMMNST